MSKSIIAEGKTTNEAIEKGLKELNTSKNMVDIKVLENEEKRSFFSILAPRIVKVQLTVKEEKHNKEHAYFWYHIKYHFTYIFNCEFSFLFVIYIRKDFKCVDHSIKENI